MEIGSNGLAEVNLTIPQSTSLVFDVVHKDSEGNVVDHSNSTARMAIQTKKANYVLDECCTCSSQGIHVSITPEISEGLPVGKSPWDMIVEMLGGENVRMCYGTARIVDTYAEDEERA